MVKRQNSFITSSALLVALVFLSACSDLSRTEQRVLSGGAIGAGTGAAVTVLTGGCIGCGAAIGGAVGAASGYVYDKTIGKK